jgi:hypothetical protein
VRNIHNRNGKVTGACQRRPGQGGGGYQPLDGVGGLEPVHVLVKRKVLGYAAWKQDLKRLHVEVYLSLKVDSLMEKCLPESIKEKIRDKQSIEDVWMNFMRPDTFPHDLMLPVNTAKAVLHGGCWKLTWTCCCIHSSTPRSRDDTRSATYQQPEADVLEVAGQQAD